MYPSSLESKLTTILIFLNIGKKILLKRILLTNKKVIRDLCNSLDVPKTKSYRQCKSRLDFLLRFQFKFSVDSPELLLWSIMASIFQFYFKNLIQSKNTLKQLYDAKLRNFFNFIIYFFISRFCVTHFDRTFYECS